MVYDASKVFMLDFGCDAVPVDTIGIELWRIASTTTPTAEPEVIEMWVEYTRFINQY